MAPIILFPLISFHFSFRPSSCSLSLSPSALQLVPHRSLGTSARASSQLQLRPVFDVSGKACAGNRHPTSLLCFHLHPALKLAQIRGCTCSSASISGAIPVVSRRLLTCKLPLSPFLTFPLSLLAHWLLRARKRHIMKLVLRECYGGSFQLQTRRSVTSEHSSFPFSVGFM